MGNLFRLRINTEYLRFIIKRNSRFMLLMSVAMLVVFPVLYITSMTLNPGASYESVRVLGQVLSLILLLISAFILPILLLSYMHKKKDLDVYHALPIKQADLFVTTLIGSIVLMSVPFIVSWLGGNLISLDANYSWMMMLENGLSSLLIAIAITSIVTFALVNVGTSLDGLLYAVLLNLLPVLAYFSYNLFRSIVFLGFNQNFSLDIMGIIFPIWSLFETNFEYSSRLFEQSILYGIYWLIWSIILFAISRGLYTRRKHERAESAFTNDFFFPLISTFFMILLIFILYGSFYSMNSSETQGFYHPANFIFPFFFAGIVYLVMDTISQRSFKHLFKAMFRYLLIALLSFTLVIAGLFTRGFAFVSKVPELNSVSSIEFTLNDYNNLIFNNNYTYNKYYERFDTLVVDDAQGMETLIDFHQLILNEYKWIDYSTRDIYSYNPGELIDTIQSKPNYVASYESYPINLDDNSYGYSNLSVSFIYHLENGNTIARYYNIPYEWTYLLYELYDSPSIVGYTAKNVALSDRYSTLKQASLRNVGNPQLVVLDQFDLSKFKEFYLQDMSTWSASDYTTLQGPTLATLNLISVDKSNNRLESDIVLNNLTPLSNAYIESLSVFPSVGTQTNQMLLLLADDTSNNSIYHRATTSGTYFNIYDQESRPFRYVYLNADLLQAIMPYTTQVGFSEESMMSIVLTDLAYSSLELDDRGTIYTLVIKPEYTQDVLGLISDSQIQTSQDLYSSVFDTKLRIKE